MCFIAFGVVFLLGEELSVWNAYFVEDILFCQGFVFNATGPISVQITGTAPIKCGIIFPIRNKDLDF